jgi:hypothetical protein
MISVDKYFNRKYNEATYNCAHLVIEVWKDLTDQDISFLSRGFLLGNAERFVDIKVRNAFRQTKIPIDPSILILRGAGLPPHCGVYLRDRVLHITHKGVVFQLPEIATMLYPIRKYYAWSH